MREEVAASQGIKPNERDEQTAEDLFLLETCLQWHQVQRQQCLNLKFARPLPFSEGELAALNRAIVKLEQTIQHKFETMTSIH